MISENVKKTLAYYNTILIEILICFSVFAIFFGIFTNYFFNEFEENLISKFINQSVSFYKILFLTSNNEKIINKLTEDNDFIKTLELESHLEEEKVKAHNKKYDHQFLIIIAIMILILLVICLLPMILGIVNPADLDFKYLAIKLFLHAILIVAFEMIFVLYVLPLISPIKIHEIIKENSYYKKFNYGL